MTEEQKRYTLTISVCAEDKKQAAELIWEKCNDISEWGVSEHSISSDTRKSVMNEELQMKERRLKVGDVVVLKSGGPSMTIDTINDQCAVCKWIDERDEILHEGTFDLMALELIICLRD